MLYRWPLVTLKILVKWGYFNNQIKILRNQRVTAFVFFVWCYSFIQFQLKVIVLCLICRVNIPLLMVSNTMRKIGCTVMATIGDSTQKSARVWNQQVRHVRLHWNHASSKHINILLSCWIVPCFVSTSVFNCTG